jgi:hypothetical protein
MAKRWRAGGSWPSAADEVIETARQIADALAHCTRTASSIAT